MVAEAVGREDYKETAVAFVDIENATAATGIADFASLETKDLKLRVAYSTKIECLCLNLLSVTPIIIR